jgi:Flp pilus assembly protein TadG
LAAYRWRLVRRLLGPRNLVRLRRRRDAGSATVELAVSLPALALLLFASLTAIVAVRTQLQCLDAAREAARAAARGESGTAAGMRVAPDGASIGVSTTAAEVHTIVRVRLNPLGGRLPGFDISETAVAALEPTTGE